MSIGKEIKAALKDVTVDGKAALSIVEEAFDKADAVEKVKKANDDLSSQRKEWENKEKEYKLKLADFEKTDKEKAEKISFLEKEKLTPEEREKLKIAESVKADYNKLAEEVKALRDETTASNEKRVEAEKKAREATFESHKQSQRTAISNELNKYKITDSKNVTALHTLFGEGHVKLEAKEDGTIEEKYYTKNSKGEKVTSTMPELIKSFAENNQYLVSSSGNSGTGQGHNNNYNHNGNVDFSDYKKASAKIDAEWDMAE